MDAFFHPARFKGFLSGITLFIALTLILVSSIHDVYSAQVTLEWDPNTQPDLAGYRLNYGTESRDHAEVIDVGNQASWQANKPTSSQAGKRTSSQENKRHRP